MSQKATRAKELNHAISGLWQAAGIYSKDDFNQHVVPIYTALLTGLQQHQPRDVAEAQLLALLHESTAACHRRWTKRLPLKRPGSDYRKYEIIYTEALITAMAVGCLKQHEEKPPDQLAAQLIPQDTLKRLQADPMVWQDWLGFFFEAEEGGLYAVSTGVICQHPPAPNRASAQMPRSTPSSPPPGSGRAMLDAIRSALNDGTLSYNQPGDFVQVDRAGRTFLEHPKILKWCNDQLGLNEDLKKLKSRFSRLKVLNRSERGKQFFYGRAGKDGHRRVGFVIDNHTVVWRSPVLPGKFQIETLEQ